MKLLDLFACEGGATVGYQRAGWDRPYSIENVTDAGAYGGARRDKYEAKYVRKGGYVPADKDVVKALLGVEHDMTWGGLYECLPPAYTDYIGTELRALLEVAA